MKILLTGGAGFIGSHTCIELIKAGHEAVIADDLSNSKPAVLERLKELTGKDIPFYNIDVADKEKVDHMFAKESFDAVIHFAGFKAVGESVAKPLMYYRNNLDTTLTLLETMAKYNVSNFVFSSSATVYGVPERVPLVEGMKTGCTNPYGWTKLMIEQILTDAAAADKNLSVVLLRYFNPIGAHPSGRIGEDPTGIPNNLLPYITQVAIGKLPQLGVFGNDYPTHDGTGVRDYIHVVDLAKGHVKAIQKLEKCPDIGVKEYNLGTGIGYSVLDVIENFSKACGKQIPYEITERRHGDIAECYANASLAKEELGWEAEYGIKEMCEDTWNWQKKNPNGYKGV